MRIAPHIGLGAGNARVEREVHDRGGEHDVLHGVAERGDDAHGQHEQREGHDGVGDAADNAIGPAAEKTGGDTGKPAHQKDERDRRNGDEEIKPRRHHDAAEDVAAELVGAEPVHQRRTLERGHGIAGERIVGDEIGTDQRGQHDQQEQPEGKAGDRVLAEDVAGVAEHCERRRARFRASVRRARFRRVAALAARFARQRGTQAGIVPRLGRGALARQGDIGHASTLMRGSITP
jgi:hypothetical protein